MAKMDGKIPQTKGKQGSGVAVVYVVLRVLVVAVLVHAIITKQWHNVVYCVLTLFMFLLPSIIERRLKIELPSALEVVVIIFIFAGEVLGEVAELFIKVSYWDLILHTTTGFLMAAIGITLIDVLNQSPKINMSLSPFFVAFVAFCFSMTIGVLWEFTEYAVDQRFGGDMQKDVIVSTVGSVELNPDGRNKPLWITDITQSTITGKVKGEETTLTVDGYLDIGLNDTMEDMFVNLIGALVFSAIGAVYIKTRGQGRVAGAFIPRMLTQEEAAEAERAHVEKKEYKKLSRRERKARQAQGSSDDNK